MTSFYLVFLITILLVAYAGTEETMRLFAYADLQLRYAWVRIRMFLIRRKLRRQLLKDFPQLIEELENDQQ